MQRDRIHKGCRKWQDGQENLSDKLSSVRQFWFEEYTKSVLLSNCWTVIYANICKWLDNAVSNSRMNGQWCVKLSNCRTVLWPTVQLAKQCCVKLANGWTLLCPTVQWLVTTVFNCHMVCHCFVQLSNGQTVLSIGWTVLCQAVNGWTTLCPAIQLSQSVSTVANPGIHGILGWFIWNEVVKEYVYWEMLFRIFFELTITTKNQPACSLL